mgnify:CR=1 FL=1
MHYAKDTLYSAPIALFSLLLNFSRILYHLPFYHFIHTYMYVHVHAYTYVHVHASCLLFHACETLIVAEVHNPPLA